MKHLVILLIEILTFTVQINRILIVKMLGIRFYSQKDTTRYNILKEDKQLL